MKKRIEYLDHLRVFALISIIAIHIFGIIRTRYLGVNNTYYHLFTFADSFTRAGVPLFLMLTGYLVLSTKKELQYKDFIKKRLPKLIIPFFIISIFYYIYIVIDRDLSYGIIDFIERFTTNNIMYHLWYMYVIIVIYLLIPFEKRLLDNLKEKELLILILLTYVLGNIFYSVSLFSIRYEHGILGGFNLPTLLIYNNYLVLGYYLSKHELKNKRIIYILGALSLIIMPIVDAFFIENNLRNDAMLNATSIFPIFYTLGIYQIVKDNYKKIKIPLFIKKQIVRISDLSLYIYLLHVLVLDFISRNLNKIWIQNRLYENVLVFFILLIGTFIGSYILAIIFNYLYNKTKEIINKNFTKKKK